MAYTTNRDWNTTELEYTKTPWPLPPLNLFMSNGFQPGMIDLTWNDPAILALNSKFQILGVNIYRSFDSAFGPFDRITDILACSTFWRDSTDNELVIDEDVSNQFVIRGESGAGYGNPRWVFKTLYSPIVKEGSQSVVANVPEDVWVKIDGVTVQPLRVDGFSGEVEINPFLYADVVTQKMDPSLVPGPNSTVTCTYRRTRTLVKTDLNQRIFYRITTVGAPLSCDLSKVLCDQDLIETPLESATATSTMEIEKLDYMWREAVRRNRFILEQGGERVKLFLRKNVGIPCTCVQDEHHGQPLNDCQKCFSSGIIGGFEGPYDALVAPDDAERRIAQKDIGRALEHTYEVWTGPTPLLSQRDFLMKINGDRYSIGPVRFPTNRGMVLQQHFNIGHLDEKDIRYKVPVGNPVKYAAVQFGPKGPEQEAEANVTEKPNIPDERELRGRSKVWENTQY